MSKIKIKNFGPIKEGLTKNDGFIDIKKVTVFIGYQATGKSTIVKIYSTLTWLEKALYREDIKESDIIGYNRFINKFCAYQGLKTYFNKNTYIKYLGDSYTFEYVNEKISIIKNKNKYLAPKIMYIPAERNFLSLVDNPEKLKQLPLHLYTFLEEFEKSKKYNSTAITLPINNISFEFQKQNKISYIKGIDYKIKLSEASSGIQSLLPIYLVSKFLSQSINKESDNGKKMLSVEEHTKLKREVKKILKNDKLSDELKEASLELLSSSFKNACFINIVEEMEQNLFPESQKQLLYSLLEFANISKGNKLLLTTHSPYIINYLTLAIKGDSILNKIATNEKLKSKLETILPIKSCINGDDTIIYELKTDGSIEILSTYNNLPSDENYLNMFLEETNDDFNQLLDIEDELYAD
ncbi:MAG: AAA family ATPase [Sulfurovum sp.]